VVSFTPRPLYHQGKNPLYPLARKLIDAWKITFILSELNELFK